MSLKDDLDRVCRAADTRRIEPLMWGELDAIRARLARAEVIEPEPTAAELLDALRRELGGRWTAEQISTASGWYRVWRGSRFVTWGQFVSLRKHGPKATADALRLLAGLDGAQE